MWINSITSSIVSDEDNFRCPQRVCDTCSYQLKDLQPELRQLVSRANQVTSMDNGNGSNGSMPNLPSVDFYMENEIKKAASMLYCFTNTLGEEKIPKELLEIAKGVVFFTIVKAGFMFTGRYGSGIVVAKLNDGRWSAPSAVTISGVGWGLQIGAELTDVMLILSTESAVNTFKSRAQISVGAELGVSVGPIGRSIESDVTAGNKGTAHAFSYAQSKGLFFGASLEASAIGSRPDVNRAFYGEKISVSALLNGDYPPPKGAEPLYKAIHDVLTPSSPYGTTNTASGGMMYSSRSAKETQNPNFNNGYAPPGNVQYSQAYLNNTQRANGNTQPPYQMMDNNHINSPHSNGSTWSSPSSSTMLPQYPPQSQQQKQQQPQQSRHLDEFGLDKPLNPTGYNTNHLNNSNIYHQDNGNKSIGKYESENGL
eukprot:CAMPEP_0170070704 /NCGR_PEP_ID=MMETSP0019_2-20121128/8894_1 /TAXON_ID=98059 /ORGANISM="Dinobryon sp., Strain UTEXLB2267" /LENGTH=424 /DNA_ID=CAMNT_0010279045 /DNA_START=174 /DNA_END=1448 /DNA_ORIENTATION=-